MQTEPKLFYCRWSPTLGALEDTHEKIWGTKTLIPMGVPVPCVFFGLYGLRDFFALWEHKGPRFILWAGSDIRHFLNGYFLDAEGAIRITPFQLAPWIDTYCTSYVENEVEKKALASVGIRAKVVPSFLGDVNAFPESFMPSKKPKLYTSVSGDDFELYGWNKILPLARENPGIEFHLYGNTKEPFPASRMINDIGENSEERKNILFPTNVIVHGRVPKEQMNAEISTMQGALRLCEFDGFSEILAKSVLMGQWPVSVIEYPHILKLSEIGLLLSPEKQVPNLAGRHYYLKTLNQFPWNTTHA